MSTSAESALFAYAATHPSKSLNNPRLIPATSASGCLQRIRDSCAARRQACCLPRPTQIPRAADPGCSRDGSAVRPDRSRIACCREAVAGLDQFARRIVPVVTPQLATSSTERLGLKTSGPSGRADRRQNAEPVAPAQAAYY